jgi:hypothetical protein
MRGRVSRQAACLLLVAVLTAAATAASRDRAVNEETGDPLVGAWRLVWLEEAGADGRVHRAECSGMLVYTRDGHMSVQVMYRSPQAEAPAGPVQYAQGGYEGSFGRYEVDPDAHTFTYHVEGALVRSLVGKDLVRVFEMSGKQMTVKSSNPDERWRVAWERY